MLIRVSPADYSVIPLRSDLLSEAMGKLISFRHVKQIQTHLYKHYFNLIHIESSKKNLSVHSLIE